MPTLPPRIAETVPACRSKALVLVRVPPVPLMKPLVSVTVPTVSLNAPISSVPPETVTPPVESALFTP